MTTPTPPELFSQQPIRSEFSSYRKSGRGLKRGHTLLIALVLIIAAVIGAFMMASTDDQTGEIPTVRADGATKERPEQPGGLEIPHQDMLVFQQIEKGDGDKQAVERLLPPPEMPQPLPTTAGSPIEMPVTPVAQVPAPAAAPLPVVEPAVKAATTVIQPKSVPAEPSPVTAGTAAPAPVQPQSIEIGQPVSKATTPKTVTPKQLIVGKLPKDLFLMKNEKNITVQLAAVGDSLAAQTMSARLQTKYASLLGGAKLRTVKADLGAKGIYYRIQSEPMTEATAKNLCATLMSQKAACMIVRQ